MPPSEQDNLLSICRNLNGALNGFAQQISCRTSPHSADFGKTIKAMSSGRLGAGKVACYEQVLSLSDNAITIFQGCSVLSFHHLGERRYSTSCISC